MANFDDLSYLQFTWDKPESHSALKIELNVPGNKLSKDRITNDFCWNALGLPKLPYCIVENHARPTGIKI